METINFIGLMCLTWLLTTGSAPIEFIKEFFDVHDEPKEKKGNIKKVLTKLFNCDLCLGFWIGLLFYQNILIACIFSLSCEIFGRVLAKLGF